MPELSWEALDRQIQVFSDAHPIVFIVIVLMLGIAFLRVILKAFYVSMGN